MLTTNEGISKEIGTNILKANENFNSLSGSEECGHRTNKERGYQRRVCQIERENGQQLTFDTVADLLVC